MFVMPIGLRLYVTFLLGSILPLVCEKGSQRHLSAQIGSKSQNANVTCFIFHTHELTAGHYT